MLVDLVLSPLYFLLHHPWTVNAKRSKLKLCKKCTPFFTSETKPITRFFLGVVFVVQIHEKSFECTLIKKAVSLLENE